VAIILTGFSIRIFADGGMVAIITNNIISTQPQGVVSSNKNILIKDADSSEWQTSLNNVLDFSNLPIGTYKDISSPIYIKNNTERQIIVYAQILLDDETIGDEVALDIYVGTPTLSWRGQQPVYSGHLGLLQYVPIAVLYPNDEIDVHFVAKALDNINTTTFGMKFIGE